MNIFRQALANPGTTGRRLGAFLGFALLIFVLDQATKAMVRNWLPLGETWPEGWTVIRIAHVQNTGAAFGIFQGGTSYLAIASVFAILAIVVFLVTLPSHTRWYPLALSGILGGAVGNLVDRVRLGYVTDFIDPMRYPSFNVADSAIVLSVGLVAFLTLFGHEDPPVGSEAQEDGAARARQETQT
ncbi:MAG: signal peptidase II [Dehalococcoidia bacterium]